MSQEGYDKLIAELHRLEAVERPKASAAIAEAREKGDLSENSEYDAAKEAQAHLEDKINRLKATISEAKIVDTSRLSTDCVQILTKVEMTNLTTKSKMSYTIVSENEADLRAGKISIKTPIAQGLLGKKRARNPRRSGRSARWLSGSNGSPPRSESPCIHSGAQASSAFSAVSSVQGLPCLKSHVSGLKHPGHRCVHPLTKSDTLTPGPFATSHVLIAE